MLFKYVCLLCMLLVLVAANEEDVHATLLSSYKEQDQNGHFKHGHEISNGISIKVQGDVNGMQGEYFLPGEDGKPVRVTYTADATGFHPHVEGN